MTPRIYADFNGYYRKGDVDCVELDTLGTLIDLHRLQVRLSEGLEIMAWIRVMRTRIWRSSALVTTTRCLAAGAGAFICLMALWHMFHIARSGFRASSFASGAGRLFRRRSFRERIGFARIVGSA